MGWSNVAGGVLEATTVIVTAGSAISGIFVYNGAPATGNLVGSWTASSGTDAFGNAYGAGFNIGTQSAAHLSVDLAGDLVMYDSTDTAQVQIASSSGNVTVGTSAHGTINLSPSAGQLNIQNPAGSSQIILDGPTQTMTVKDLVFGDYIQLNTAPPQIFFAAPWLNGAGQIALSGGTSPTQPWLSLFSPTMSSATYGNSCSQGWFPGLTTVGAPRPFTAIADLLGTNPVDIHITGAVISTTTAAGTTVNTWQAPSLGTGWASGAFSGTFQGLQFRIDAEDNLYLVGVIHSTSATPASTVFTLPAAFRPRTAQRVPVTANAGGTYSAHSMEIATTGVVTLDPAFSVANADLYTDALVPMGNIS